MALDQFAAAVVFNRPDLTISTMCWMVANDDYANLKPSRWQWWVLAKLGPILNWIQTDHCKGAALADYNRAQSTVKALQTMKVGP